MKTKINVCRAFKEAECFLLGFCLDPLLMRGAAEGDSE